MRRRSRRDLVVPDGDTIFIRARDAAVLGTETELRRRTRNMRLIGTGKAPSGQYPEGYVFDSPAGGDESRYLIEQGWAREPKESELVEADEIRIAQAVIRGDAISNPLDQEIAARIAGREHAIVHSQDSNAQGDEPGALEPFNKQSSVGPAGGRVPSAEAERAARGQGAAVANETAKAGAPETAAPTAEPDSETHGGTDGDEGESEELTGDALQERARELEIEGRSSLSADELREAVKKAEAEKAGS